MRFTCGSCDAQYSIADEKVRDRILRVQCKRCSSPILIKYEPAEEEEEPMEDVVDDATKVMRQDDVRRAIEIGEPVGARIVAKAAIERAPSREATPVAEVKEWFFLDKGQEVGPLTRTVFARHIESGRLTPRTYVWRDGMPDWLRLEAVEPLADLLALVPSESTSAEPPAPGVSEEDPSDEYEDDRTEIGSFELPEEDDESDDDRTQVADIESAFESEPESLSEQLADELADELVDDSEGDLRHLLATEAAATGGAAASNDPFAMVPDDPEFLPAEPGEATNAVIKASGANERRTGRIVAGALIFVAAVAAVLWFGGKSGVLVIPQAAPKASTAPTTDWSKVEALDDSAMGILSGETKKRQEEEAQRAATATRRRDSNNELAGLIPRDVDDAGAVKRVQKTEPTVELSPQQQAQLARMREERAAGGGPGSAGPRQFVDTGFDVNKASGDGPDSQLVAKKVGEAQPAVALCVGSALRRNPSQKVGKVVVVATIGSSGLVSRAEFREDRYGIASTELGDCVRKVVKNIVFPSFDGDAIDLEIPFVLSGG